MKFKLVAVLVAMMMLAIGCGGGTTTTDAGTTDAGVKTDAGS